MAKRFVPMLATLLLATALSGCTRDSDDHDDEDHGDFEGPYLAGADQSWFSVGPAYRGDADGAKTVACVILIQADEEANTGFVNFHLDFGEVDDQFWNVTMREFHAIGGAEYQDGGIESDFEGFGDTGKGGSVVPKVQVEMAGWGEVVFERNHTPVPDPVTGADTWLGEYRVLLDAVRDDATGAIHDGSGTGFYDPGAPTDATVLRDVQEAHFTLRPHAAPSTTPVPVSAGPFTTSASEPHTARHDLFNNTLPGTSVTLNVTLARSTALTTVTYEVVDPDGDSVLVAQGGQATLVDQATPISFTAKKFGVYTLSVAGDARGSDYSIDGQTVAPRDPAINLWWNEVLYDDAALQRYDARRHGAH